MGNPAGFFSAAGSSSTASVSMVVGIACVAGAAVALVLRNSRSTATKDALISADEEAKMQTESSGIVQSRLKSFNEFMKGQTLDPQEQGFEMNESGVDSVRVEA